MGVSTTHPILSMSILIYSFDLYYVSAACAETGMKNGVKEVEHEFPFVICHLEKQDYLFRCSDAGGNFPLGRLKKVVYHLLLSRISRRFL